jgi:hypothetical protein
VYTLVAEDLAYWLEKTSDELAAAMSPQGVAPFGAVLSEAQKVAYYKQVLFNSDGTPNTNGRTQLLATLGPQGFRQVYTAVITAYPYLRIPTPPELTPAGELEPPQQEGQHSGQPNQPQPGQSPYPGASGQAPPIQPAVGATSSRPLPQVHAARAAQAARG